MGMVPLPRSPIVESSVVPLREARLQLVRLVALAELNDTVTLIAGDGDGRPRAAIVPAGAARSLAQSAAQQEQDRERASMVAAGWERRVEEARAVTRRQFASETQALRRALRELWQCLDAGDSRGIDQLRRTHAELVRE